MKIFGMCMLIAFALTSFLQIYFVENDIDINVLILKPIPSFIIITILIFLIVMITAYISGKEPKKDKI
jgi:hypothetical protein